MYIMLLLTFLWKYLVIYHILNSSVIWKKSKSSLGS